MTTRKMFETMDKALSEVYNLHEVLRDLNGSTHSLVSAFMEQDRGLWFDTKDMSKADLFESLVLEAPYGAIEEDTYKKVFVSEDIVETLKRNVYKGSIEEGYVHMGRNVDNKLCIVDLHKMEGFDHIWMVTFNH